MARYIDYAPQVYAIQDVRGVSVWLFPPEFSQSRLGDRIIGSNACTLIAVLLAGRIDEYKIQLWGYIDQPLSRMLVNSLAEAIVDGNEIHETLSRTNQLVNINLNVPEALQAIQYKYPFLTEWSAKTVTILTPLEESFAENVEPPLFDWTHNPPRDKKEASDLFIVLLADVRSVLFIYQPQLSKITLVDSHTHLEREAGALCAQAHVGDLNQLCTWFCGMCHLSFGRGNAITPYELAFLYSQDPYY